VRKLVFGAVCVVLLAIAGVAYAATQQKFDESFTTSSPARSAGLKFSLEGSDPANPANQRPKPSNSIDIFFASGTVVNSKGAVQCKATDPDFQAKAEKACPASSRIDNGSSTQNAAEAKLSSGGPIAVKIFAFNRKGGLILYLKPSIGAPFVLRPALKGKAGKQHLLTTIPKIAVTATEEVILTKFKLGTKAKHVGSTAFIKTPPKTKCPKSKLWTFKAVFNYRDGTKQTVTDTQKCKR
jgi:hypothetical protein